MRTPEEKLSEMKFRADVMACLTEATNGINQMMNLLMEKTIADMCLEKERGVAQLIQEQGEEDIPVGLKECLEAREARGEAV